MWWMAELHSGVLSLICVILFRLEAFFTSSIRGCLFGVLGRVLWAWMFLMKEPHKLVLLMAALRAATLRIMDFCLNLSMVKFVPQRQGTMYSAPKHTLLVDFGTRLGTMCRSETLDLLVDLLDKGAKPCIGPCTDPQPCLWCPLMGHVLGTWFPSLSLRSTMYRSPKHDLMGGLIDKVGGTVQLPNTCPVGKLCGEG